MVLSGTSVLVTGAAGFVGANLVDELIRRQADVHVMVRPGGDPTRLSAWRGRLTLHAADLRERSDVEQAVSEARPAYVFNLARPGGGPNAPWSELAATNVVGIANLLETLAAAGSRRLVQLGTALEYGPSDQPLDERSTAAPLTAAGATKASATALCLAASRSGALPATVLRPFMVYGPRDRERRLVPTAIRAALAGEELPLTGPGCRRDWIYVADVVEACLLALDGRADGEVVNLATGRESSNEEVVRAIERAVGRSLRVRREALPARDWDRPHWAGSTSTAQELLGWRARTALESGIRHTVDWTRAAAPPPRLRADELAPTRKALR